MDALVMCGGRGTRLNCSGEKPLVPIRDKPMIEPVLDACIASTLDEIYGVVTPQVPRTHDYLQNRSIPCIETPGAGYVADLNAALAFVEKPVLTVVSDLPLLEAELLDELLEQYQEGSLTVCVPTHLKERHGLSVDLTLTNAGQSISPTGLNIVGADTTENYHVIEDIRLAVNVNRPTDVTIAEERQ